MHKVVAYAKCMDERGYDTFWMAEHHFQPEGTEFIPNLLMMAMHLCGITKNLRIGCGFNIVPMWHPLRLAEDYAMADILTGGRVIFGCRARLPHPRGRDFRRAAYRPERQPRDVRGGCLGPVQGLRGQIVLAQGQVLHDPPRGAVSRLYSERDHPGAAPERLPVEWWQPIRSGSERAFGIPRRHRRWRGGLDTAVSTTHHCHNRSVISRASMPPSAGARLRAKELLMPDLDLIKQGEQASARPARGRYLKFAAHRGRNEGWRLSRRPAGGYHRAIEGGRAALSRLRPRHLRNPARRPARKHPARLSRKRLGRRA